MALKCYAALLVLTSLWTIGPAAAQDPPDLKKVTGPSAWLGTAVMNAWWAADGRHLYWQQIDPAGGGLLTWEMSTKDGTSTLLTEPLPPALDGPRGVTIGLVRWSPDGSSAVVSLSAERPVSMDRSPWPKPCGRKRLVVIFADWSQARFKSQYTGKGLGMD